MNKRFLHFLSRSLATMCLIAGFICPGLLNGQQLLPLPANTGPPVQPASTPQVLTPLVTSSAARSGETPNPLQPLPVTKEQVNAAAGAQPPIVAAPRSAAENAPEAKPLPRIVTAPQASQAAKPLPRIVTTLQTSQDTMPLPRVVAAAETVERGTTPQPPEKTAITVINLATDSQARSVQNVIPVIKNPYVVDPDSEPADRPMAETNSPVFGKNFPADGRQQIEQFIRQNSVAENIQQAGFAQPPLAQPVNAQPAITTPTMVAEAPMVQPTVPAPTQPQILQSGRPMLPRANFRGSLWQESSPSDVPMEFIPAPGQSAQNANPPVMNTPSMIEQIPGPNAFYAPQPGLPSQPGVVQNEPIVGDNTYFDQSHIYDSAGDYGGGTYSPADVDFGSIDDTFACCGFVSGASNYFIFDSLVWARGDGDFRAGNFTSLDTFDWAGGGRVTYGARRDCTRGWEITYQGFDPWLAVTTQYNPPGTLFGAIFGSVGGYPDSTFSAFRNATFLEQFQKTDLHSVEFNQTWWGSDVAKAYLGVRFLYFDDEFRLSSQNIFDEIGIHTIDTTNNMFGVHWGSEVLYDIGYRLAFSFSGKLGVYANFWEGRRALLNNNTLWFNTTQRSTDWGASAELGVFGRYKLSPNARFRFGYEIMALSNVYDTETNFRTTVLPTTTTAFERDGAFFHGATFGFEIYR